MSSPTPLPFTSQLALSKLSSHDFETQHPPQKMGNPLNIAYGGYALAVACKSAHLTVPENYNLYSMQGNFLGPAYTDRPLRASVRVIRQTRTFATRQVEVSQARDDDGELRVCLIALADFQIREKDTLLVYNRTPSRSYANWKECPTQTETYQKILDTGNITKELHDAHKEGFKILENIYDMRPCPEGVFSQNLYGVAKDLPLEQDHLDVHERATADWFRCVEPLHTSVDHVTNLTFMLDKALAFLPLSFSHRWFDDVAALSSLDFSLRVFRNGRGVDGAGGGSDGDGGIDVNKWLLREMKTSVGGEGRSFSESWVWDEEGRAVACMSQQSILRPDRRRKGRGKL